MKNKCIYITIIIGLIYMSPFMIGGFLYNDDWMRTPYPYGWDHNGRYFSTILMNIIGNGQILNINPFSTIASSIILSLSGAYISQRYIPSGDLFSKVCISLLLITSPFYLANYSFQFDILPMSAAIAITIFSNRFSGGIMKCSILKIIALTVSIGIYQSVVNIAMAFILLDFIFNYRYYGKSFKLCLKDALKTLGLVIASVAIYRMFIYNESDISAYTKLMSEIDKDFIVNIPLKLYSYLEVFNDLFFGGLGKVFLMFYILPVILLIIKGVNDRDVVRSLITISAFILICLLSIGTLLFLKRPPVESRAMISSSFVMIASALIIYKEINLRKLNNFLFILPILVSFIFCSSLFMVQKLSQSYYYTSVNLINSYANMTSKITPSKEYIKALRNPPGVVFYENAFPFIKRIAPNIFNKNILSSYTSVILGRPIYLCDNLCLNNFNEKSKVHSSINLDVVEDNGNILYIIK